MFFRIIAAFFAIWMVCFPCQAFDEIEDLSKPGILGNKGDVPLPQNEYENVTILGPATASRQQMVRYILNNNPEPLLSCSVDELVDYYYEEAAVEGVRPDVALCQAILETGFFCYRNANGEGNVDAEQNNFCGLGSTDAGVAGASFATPRDGVRAHIQHIIAYAVKRLPKNPVIDPRYEILLSRYPQYHGAVQYWVGLNGRWAVPGDEYGQHILSHWYAAQEE